jgi:LysR family transcriptional regulator, glycine cleavage system transcriptional activator
MRRLPPLNAVRTFESAARHLSFTKAAEELLVTQAAVSYQIRQLEEHIGLPLFRRLTRRLELTPEGADFHRDVSDAFDRLHAAVDRLADRKDGAVLSITTLQTFAMQWLVPRLGHFQLRHPQMAVRLDSSARMQDLEREYDLGIRSGSGTWPDVEAHKLVDYVISPLLSPDLAGRAGSLRTPADLLQLPLLDTVDPEDRRHWQEWFSQAGVCVESLPGGSQFDTQFISGMAAVMGQGVALVCPMLFAAELAAGRLIMPFPAVQLQTGVGYWLVYSRRRAREVKIRAFRDWILSEVAACGGQCAVPPPAPASTHSRTARTARTARSVGASEPALQHAVDQNPDQTTQ